MTHVRVRQEEEEERKGRSAVMNVGLIVFGEKGLKASPQAAWLR